MTKIGILLRDQPYGMWYFFCNGCSSIFYEDEFTIYKVYKEQFPENWGQVCHGSGCGRVLKHGLQLFERYEDIHIEEVLVDEPSGTL